MLTADDPERQGAEWVLPPMSVGPKRDHTVGMEATMAEMVSDIRVVRAGTMQAMLVAATARIILLARKIASFAATAVAPEIVVVGRGSRVNDPAAFLEAHIRPL